MTAKRLEQDIRGFELFPVRIRHGRDGRDVRSDKAKFRGYSARWERIARNSHTVADWKRRRFAPYYSGFEVDALRLDGRVAHGGMSLEKLRAEHARKRRR
jgi:hypothetical protein